ncbi:General transcription factor 3C polypeptide 3 [Bienertia sinuspersici]
MEGKDGMNEDNPFEEREEENEGKEEEEEEEEEDGGGGEEGEDEDEMEEEEEEECLVRFKGDINPLDFVEDGTSQIQLYQQFERLEYEALAEKKRKALAAIQGEGSLKRPRQEITVGAEEMRIVDNFYGSRRGSRKPKKRGRRKGSKNKLSPEITQKLGDANLHYAHGRYEDAISLLNKVVRLAPNLPDPYHTLGLVYNSMGDKKKSLDCYLIAAYVGPRDSPLWKLLVTWSIEQGNFGQARSCIDKAIKVDPADVTLWYHRASIYTVLGECSKAAESYDRIIQICPDNVEALKTAATLYKQSGLFERSIVILEDYLNKHPSEADLTVVDMLAFLLMESNMYSKALHHIEHAKACGFMKEFPLCLKVKEGICHARLGNMEKAEICFSPLQRENAENQLDLIMEVANSFADLHQHESALKYYLMVEGCISKNDFVSLKIAHCYLALKKASSAIQFFYKALRACEDDIDARLALTSLLLEENREDEAVELLSPPPSAVLSQGMHTDNLEPWWLNVKVKLKLSHIYKTKGMLEAFVEVIYPIIHESLKFDSMHQKVKQRRRLSKNELFERVKVLDDLQTDTLFCEFRRPASKNDLLKANRAKKLIERGHHQKKRRYLLLLLLDLIGKVMNQKMKFCNKH